MFKFYLCKWMLDIFRFTGFLMLFVPAYLYSQTPPVLSFNPLITSGLNQPIDVVNAGDGSNRLFIAQKGGTVRFAQGGVLNNTVFLNISSLISTEGERGLLSISFHPDYATNGYFFVYYTDLNGDLTLSRYGVSADPNTANPLSGQVLLTIPHRTYSNHNGGKLNFGADGHLYFATGDGGGSGDPEFNAQRGDVLLGKMIRINVDNFATSAPFYTIPADNPHIAPNDNIRDEIWAFGLRNPFRWSFDRLTGDMWIGDVGQGAREEIDFRQAGTTGGINYGWRCYEGNLTYNGSGCLAANNYVFPLFDYDHSSTNGGTSVTGGMVYRGTAYPALSSWYVCIDFYSTNGWLIRPGNNPAVQRQGSLPTNVAGFGEDEAGELFAISLSGILYRVAATGTLPVKLQAFNAIAINGTHEISWKITSEQDVNYYEVQVSSDGTNYRTIGKVTAGNGSNREYRFVNNTITGNNVFYRLNIVNKDGRAEYSSVFKLVLNYEQAVIISPTLIINRIINIQLNKPFNSLQLFDLNGRLLKTQHLGSATGIIYADVAEFAKGTYLVKLSGNGTEVIRKIVIQ